MILYEINETMQLIGKLTMSKIVTDQNISQLIDIEKAHKSVNGYIDLSALSDAFMLGFTYGKNKKRGA